MSVTSPFVSFILSSSHAHVTFANASISRQKIHGHKWYGYRSRLRKQCDFKVQRVLWYLALNQIDVPLGTECPETAQLPLDVQLSRQLFESEFSRYLRKTCTYWRFPGDKEGLAKETGNKVKKIEGRVECSKYHIHTDNEERIEQQVDREVVFPEFRAVDDSAVK